MTQRMPVNQDGRGYKESEPIIPYEENPNQVPDHLPPEVRDMQNPFQGQDTNVPDIPMYDNGTAMLRVLLSDDGVPEQLKKNFWFVFHKDNVLTFLDAERKKQKLLNFDILKIDALNSTPWYNYDFNQEFQWNAARQMLETKCDRAMGLNGKNERIVIASNISENISRVEDNSGGGSGMKEGFIKRMLSRR